MLELVALQSRALLFSTDISPVHAAEISNLNAVIAGLRGDKARLESEVMRVRGEAGAERSKREQVEGNLRAEKAERER